MVGKTGFEPATPWSQTKCSTKLSYFPNLGAEFFKKYGAPERTRTSNRLIRSQVLYPIELRAHDAIDVNGAEDRNRTGTVVTYRRILSPVRLPVPPPRLRVGNVENHMERKTRFELATSTLARWRSTTELLPQKMVRVKGVEPPRPKALDPKSSASASSATPAWHY